MYIIVSSYIPLKVRVDGTVSDSGYVSKNLFVKTLSLDIDIRRHEDVDIDDSLDSYG